MTAQSDNMEAINTYFNATAAVTPGAQAVANDWRAWWNKLNWYDKNIDSKKYDEARARRNQFNLANVRNDAEKAQVLSVINTGMTSEELSGQSKKKVEEARKRVNDMTAQLTKTGTLHPTLKKGSTGEAVKEWQGIIGEKADGKFGPGTEAKTKKYQADHALKADGVVGPQTWAVALNIQAPTALKPAEEVVASIPISFSPPPRESVAAKRPPAKPKPAPKPAPPVEKTPDVVAAAQQAGPKPVPGVKPAGESAMQPQQASMVAAIKVPDALKKAPWYVKAGAAVAGTAAIVGGLIGLKKLQG